MLRHDPSKNHLTTGWLSTSPEQAEALAWCLTLRCRGLRRSTASPELKVLLEPGPAGPAQHPVRPILADLCNPFSEPVIIAQVEPEEYRLDRVIPTRLASEHAEQQVDFRLGDDAGDASPRHARSTPAEPTSLILIPSRAK